MRRAALVVLAALLAAGVVAGGLRAHAAGRRRAATSYTDGQSIRQRAEGAPVRDVLWEPAAPLGEPVNTPGDEYEPRLSADGQTLYFVRGRAGGGADIYAATRTASGWSEPAPFSPARSDADDLGPCPAPDGSAVYFYSDREGGLGGYDLWVVRRGENGWREPTNLGAAVNSPWNDYGPALAPDGATLYFASNRPRDDAGAADPADTWPATLREDLSKRAYDLYAAAVVGGELAPAAALDALNTDRNEGAPAVSPAGDFLYFASDRPGGRGGFDLYRSRRVRGGHLAPENLGEPLNTGANELDPALSMAGFEVHFSSDRGWAGLRARPTGTEAPPADQGSRRDQTGLETGPTYDVYRSVSREVFPEVDRAQAAVDWASLWERLWPWLGWLAILALLLLLGVLALRNPRWRERYGKMGLLARCLVLSLLVHALLMSLLAVWQVGSAVGELFRKPGGTRVVLAASPGGDALYSQVRGGFTQMPLLVREATPTPAEVRAPASSTLADVVPAPVASPRQSLPAPDVPEPAPPAPLLSAGPTLPGSAALAAVALDRPLTPASPASEPAPDAAAPSTPGVEPPAPRPPDAAAHAVRLPPGAVAPGAADRPLEPGATPDSAPAPTLAGAGGLATSPDLGPSPAPLGVTVPGPPAPGPVAGESRLEVAPASPAGPAAPDAARTAPGTPALAATPPQRPARLGDEPSVAPAAAPDAPDAPASSAAGSPALPDLLPAPAFGAQVRTPALQAAAARAEAVLQAAPALPEAGPSGGSSPPVPAPAPAVSVADTGQPAPRGPWERPLTGLDAAVPRIDAPPDAPGAAPAPPALGAGEPAPAFAGLAVPADLPDRADGAHRGDGDEPDGRAALGVDTPTDRPSLAAADAGPVAGAIRPLAPAAPAGLDTPPLTPPALASIPGPSASEISPDAPPASAPALGSSAPALAGLALPPEQPADPGERARLAMEDSIDAALRWLAAHQGADGRWASRGFAQACAQCDGAAAYDLDRATTGLALLAFLGAGHTHADPGPHREAVRRGLDWLLQRQRADGDLHAGETLYSEGMAATALAEAFARTRDPALAEPLRRAAAAIDAARSPGGGWGPTPGAPGDTTVLGWQVSALVGAKRAGVPVPQRAFQAVREWVEAVNTGPGLYALRPGEAPTTWATAQCMLARRLLGEPPSAEGMDRAARFIAAAAPDWEAAADTYTWHFTTLALRHHAGPEWERWAPAVVDQLVSHQRRDGHAAGSWDVAGDPTAAAGGRVYQTAMAALIIEAVRRDPPGYAGGVGGSPGTLSGRVLDALDGAPIDGATVRLDLPDGDSIVVRTGPDGRFTLRPVDVPAHVAVSASAPAYTPESIDVAERDLVAGLRRDFRLWPVNRNVVALESDPQVHHLGDNEWSGRINSQFQKRSEGLVYRARFALAPDQAPPHLEAAEVRILAKGTQAQNEVWVNGRQVERRLTGAPADGSFGEWRAAFPADWLAAGENTIEVRGVYGQVDYDDFEFVNVRIVLTTATPEPTGP